MTIGIEDIEHHLKQTQQRQDVLVGWVWSVLSTDAEAFCAVEECAAADALGRWVFELPSVTALLLDAICHTPGLPRKATPALLRLAETIEVVPRLRASVEQIFRSAWDELSPAMQRVVVSVVPSVQGNLELGEPWKVGEGILWPHERNFPPIETVAGRQARLLYLGYPLEDLPETWGVSSQAALIRYQIDTVLPDLGTWGATTSDALDGEAGGVMCMNREDPSTVFI